MTFTYFAVRRKISNKIESEYIIYEKLEDIFYRIFIFHPAFCAKTFSFKDSLANFHAT